MAILKLKTNKTKTVRSPIASGRPAAWPMHINDLAQSGFFSPFTNQVINTIDR